MLTAVVDIGKTHARLVVLDDRYQAVLVEKRVNSSVEAAGGWLALDTVATEQWLFDILSGLRGRNLTLSRLIVATHGAAVAGLAGEGLALPVPDYEFSGFDDRPKALPAELDPFEHTASPVLPLGLNMGVQLDWLSRHEPSAMGRVDAFLPYPQYWAWLLSGVRSSEVSSLGCHTLLWRPHERRFSEWAQRRGWAQRFPPLRGAWETLGSLQPTLAKRLSLSENLRIHTGVHDSNACMARWLRHWPRLTLVSSGTWVVVMALGAARHKLYQDADELANVSVRNEPVPTARFMGGRELRALCGGADPGLACMDTLCALLRKGVSIYPAFERQGGPYRHQDGWVEGADGPIDIRNLSAEERASLAAFYVAVMTAHTVNRLGGAWPVVLEGPFAHNSVIVETLDALLPVGALHIVKDGIEGTVLGSAMLTCWTTSSVTAPPAFISRCEEGIRTVVRLAYTKWLQHVERQTA